MELCRVCKHDKKLHGSHIGPDHTGQKIKHISCNFEVKRSKIDLDFFGITSIGHRCSCDGFKHNTSLKRAIKKYQKYLKTLDKNLSVNIYKISEIKKVIRRFRKSIKDNPKNLLHWQLEEFEKND